MIKRRKTTPYSPSTENRFRVGHRFQTERSDQNTRYQISQDRTKSDPLKNGNGSHGPDEQDDYLSN